MKNEIRHTGRIVSIDPMVTKVEIVRSSACSACHARELCGFSEEEKKIVEVPTSGFAPHEIGEEVELCLKKSMGMKAVWIAYVVPLVVLMLSILLFSALKLGELATGLGAIACVALYYFMVWCFRSKLENEFIFYIK